MLRTLALAGLLATTALALTAVPAFDAVSPVGEAQALCTGGPALPDGCLALPCRRDPDMVLRC